MARASTRTLLPLDRWAEILGLDPLHFNQVTTTDRQTRVCANPWKQFAWQESDQIGREDVAEAIQQAEDDIARQLGYKLLPTWEVDERVQTVRPGIPELLAVNATDIRGFASSIQTRFAHFISGGVERKSLIEAQVAIVFTDEDGDGYEETATIVTASDTDAEGNSVTDICEVAVYFPNEDAADEFEVRPLRSVVIDAVAGTITVTMWTHQLPDPDLLSPLSPDPVAADDAATIAANFVATLEVYRHFNDPQTQAQLIWGARPNTCDCLDGSCAVCTFSTQSGCLTARDHRIGSVSFSPATWDSTDEEFGSAELAVLRAPDRLRLWYYAGHQDNRRACPVLQMDNTLERAVTYYSLSFLDRPLCGCNNLEATVRKWREELNLSLSDGASAQSYRVSNKDLDNPFGMSRGALNAWRVVNRMERRVGRAVRY